MQEIDQLHIIAKKKFGKEYEDLDEEERKEVRFIVFFMAAHEAHMKINPHPREF